MLSLRQHADATVDYDAMSDSLLWSDEVPSMSSFEDVDLLVFRCIARYRSSLIEGVPDRSSDRDNLFQQCWDSAQQAFPTWPGFATRRCERSANLAELLNEKRRNFADTLDAYG